MQLPDQGTCSVERDCLVNILSFGMGRVFMMHANALHGPLPGFCSVTRDREGRAYVYICQDDDVHWVHMLEVCFKRFFRIRVISFFSQHTDGPAVLSFFARSFESIQVCNDTAVYMH